ncbi:polysaccharide deacetylase family protein [Emcibacter sp.]|uniref:polysaccharide deacetylase family protein n=1 Tax=Emcibacter sp. TaxID=1979954 RepID=UPI002AA5EAA0|nr:polysaccharide deacetylase family protein [Emcibacter sp.]
MHSVKLIILYLAKYLGLFHYSRKKTRRGLQILCYHGFSLADEHDFRPKLFMTAGTLERRLKTLRDSGFPVLPLGEACERLKAGSLPDNAVVITMDDGWQGSADHAWPLFRKYGFDWTLYLTTYYAEKQTQVMNLALQYLCWKSREKTVDLSSLSREFGKSLRLDVDMSREDLASRLVEIGEQIPTAQDRQDFVRRAASAFRLDQKEFEDKGLFRLMTLETSREMADSGVDIQLHTHRHTLGDGSRESLAKELADNRKRIARAGNKDPQHLCYPSGYYEPQHLQYLEELGIKSATTCFAGLNYLDTPLLELKRFLDGENISHIEFEAELNGFQELLRGFRK